MSLGTRCTSCGTIFKVVQDQLKVSEGWVRCGRCQAVFNALEGLFDLERDPPPLRPVPAASIAPSASQAGSAPSQAADETVLGTSAQQDRHAVGHENESTPAPSAIPTSAPPSPTTVDQERAWIKTEPTPLSDLPSTQEDDALESRWLVRPARDGRSATQRASRKERRQDFSDAEFPRDIGADDEAEDSFFDVEAAPASPASSVSVEATPEPAAKPQPELESQRGSTRSSNAPSRRRKRRRSREEPTPEFVRRADRQARWQSWPVRAALSVVALGLSCLLGMQVAIQYRNEINARTPELGGVLRRLCELDDCSVDAPEHLDDLSVDNNTLSQPDPSHNDYHLLIGVRNHGALPVAMPYFDVVLSDASGGLIARRSLSPQELHGPTKIAATSTLPVDIHFSTPQSVSSYTVEIFYP